MKIKTILLIYIIFFIINSVFAVELANSIQIQKEKETNEKIKKIIENDTNAVYKLLILEDFYATKYSADPEKFNTIFKNLVKTKYDYQNNTNSDNYIYAQKTIDLYKAIVTKIISDRNCEQKK